MAFQGDSIYWVEVEKIVPNPFQPRREFDEQKLKELAESVRMYGILQPLTVTRNEIQREDGTFYTEYELVAGERRLRASKLAGLSQVPVIIREGENNEQEKLEIAIIENLQREDLNAVDRALAFKQLAEVFGLSHTQVAQKIGRSREYVSNSIRLLGLPQYMLDALKRGEMTEGHARTLLMLNDRPEEQDVVFREILLKKLSVREVERIVRKIATDKVRKKNEGEFDTELIEIEKRFMETLGTRVQIQKTDYGGRLTIDYFSVEDLESMLIRMKNDQLSNDLSNKQSDLLTTNTPITILREDEEVSSKIDESIVYPEPVVPPKLESPIIEEQIANHVPDGYLPTKIETEYSVPTNTFTAPEQTPQMETNTNNVIGNNNFIPQTHYSAPAPVVQNVVHTPIATVNHYTAPTPTVSIPNPTPTPVSTPAPTYVPTSQNHESLHFVRQESPVMEYVEPKPIPAPHVTTPAPIPPVNPTVTKTAPTVEDESNLYSIRNFSV